MIGLNKFVFSISSLETKEKDYFKKYTVDIKYAAYYLLP